MVETLEEFNLTLNKAQEIFMEENVLLKQGKIAEHTALMDRKAVLLKELDAGLANLKTMREQNPSGNKESLRTLQDRIMRLLMLDRENEQLLLKQSVPSFQNSPGTMGAMGGTPLGAVGMASNNGTAEMSTESLQKLQKFYKTL